MVCIAGTVVAVEVKPQHGQAAGYASTEAKSVVQWLRRNGVYARPLGNVVYFMVTPTTAPTQSQELLQVLQRALDVGDGGKSAEHSAYDNGAAHSRGSEGAEQPESNRGAEQTATKKSWWGRFV